MGEKINQERSASKHFREAQPQMQALWTSHVCQPPKPARHTHAMKWVLKPENASPLEKKAQAVVTPAQSENSERQCAQIHETLQLGLHNYSNS